MSEFSPDYIEEDEAADIPEQNQSNFTRRQVILMAAGIGGSLALAAFASKIPWDSVAKAATVPPVPTQTPTPQPPEVDELESTKNFITLLNNQLRYRNLELILPMHEVEGLDGLHPDWEVVNQSLNYYGLSRYLVDEPMPSPTAIRVTNVDVSFLAAPSRESFDVIPPPLGIMSLFTSEEFDWKLIEDVDGYKYYAATLNGEIHPYAIESINRAKSQISNAGKKQNLVSAAVSEGYTFETAAEIYNQTEASAAEINTTSTREYEFIRGAEISSLVTQLINKYPHLKNDYRYATTDGYVNPDSIFHSASVNVLNRPDARILYSYISPVHNMFSQTIARGRGPGSDFQGILGPEAGITLVAILGGGAPSAFTTIINSHLDMIERGETPPAVFVNIPYELYLKAIGLTVKGKDYSWNEKELLQYLIDANIVLVVSLGNKIKLFNTYEQGIDWDDPEHVRLLQETHLVATKGLINSAGELTIDPNKGLPDPEDKILQDITFVAPGAFPATGFVANLYSNPENDFSDIAAPLSWFDHNITLVDQVASGSSFATVCVAAELDAFTMALSIIENRRISAQEGLARFKEAMNSGEVTMYNDQANKRNLRTLNSDLIIEMLNRALTTTNNYLPEVENEQIEKTGYKSTLRVSL